MAHSPMRDSIHIGGRSDWIYEHAFCIGRNPFLVGADSRGPYGDCPLDKVRIQKTRKVSTRSIPDLKVVEIASRPGPDGEDRLRRLFTLLVNLVSADQATSPRK